MRGEIAALLVASACVGRSAHAPAPPVPATASHTRSSGTLPAPRFEFVLSELADSSSSSTHVDPMTLEQWHVGETGSGLIEIYAADADPDELIAELLPRDTAWISQSSEVDLVSGRLVAPSRSSAIAAIAKEVGIAARLERLPPGKAPSISVRLVREPLDYVTRAITQRSGTNVMLAMHRRPPLSIVARQAAPDALLKKIAQVVEGDLSLTARGWLLYERDGGEIARLAASGGPLVDVAFDQVRVGEAIALLSMVTNVPRRALRPCGGPRKSGRVATTRLGLVLAWLVADSPRAREEPCQLPSWRGNPPILRAELVAIAWYSPTRAAALLRFGNDDHAVIRPGQNGTARAVIGPTSIEVREKGRVILEQSVEPRIKLDQPIYSTLPTIEPDHWRLAATVRDGASWRALLMHTTFEWRWVTDRDPLVRRIDRDRIILAPADPGQPEIELRLSQLPRDES